MPDFSNYGASAVTRETTKEYIFDRLEGEPSLICAPGHDDNEDWLRARLEIALDDSETQLAAEQKKPAKAAKPEKMTPDKLIKDYAEARDLNRRLIAQACVRSWGTPPVDKGGKPVEFSPANAEAFLTAIPTFMFDNFANWVTNIYVFCPKPPSPKGDGLGESSPGG